MDTVDSNLARAILTRERVGAAIGQLTREQQHVLALRFGEDLTLSEIAGILGQPTDAVDTLQRSGLAALRRILTAAVPG